MSTRTEVLLWAQRVLARKGSPAHVLLDLKQGATAEEAQEAFHGLARTAHPDLHRQALSAEDLETVTSAYALAAGAYQTLRTQVMTTQRMKPLKPSDLPSGANAEPAAPVSNLSAAQSMTPKALVYYRKAELALRRGDVKSALLQVKMAIASDPASTFLRTVMAEIELEAKKGP